jgi:hypothetical protein
VSRRRKVALSLVAVVALLFGAATLWQSAEPDPRYARILVLDPRTGETVHEQVVDGGYAVVALLSGGRVAVATMDSCLAPQKGGTLTVLDATLQRVVRSDAMPPCTVARIGVAGLRMRFGEVARGPAPTETGSGYRVEFSRGAIVEGSDAQDSLRRSNSLSAYDSAGRLLWRRASFGGWLGAVDARDGRIAVPIQGSFTSGAD